MSHDLLVELGTEEIPAGYLATAMVALEDSCQQRLKETRLSFDSVRSIGTPRRLTLLVAGLSEGQPDLEEEMVGPPARVAFDDEGKPTKAAEGFAKRNGVALDQLRKGPAEGKKGEYLLCTRHESGKTSAELLPTILTDLLSSLPWPKSMRWHEREEVFVRPVHWLVSIFGGELLPFTFAGIDAGLETRGHRFLAPEGITLTGSSEEYIQALRKAFVIVDPETRRTLIEAEIGRLEAEVGATVRPDPELVHEVANLVEYPVGICGEFPKEYLEVPEQVIVSAMRSHQRYFAMNRSDGSLLNRFITIAGTVTRDVEVVRRGNQRVLAARLADAQFFFREDQKHELDFFADKLKHVVFQKKLGTIADKVERLSAGAVGLAQDLGIDEAKVARAAALCKADLTCHMVSEFPELQGTMGRRYATLAKEDEEVCAAIEEHYLPRGASDDLPSSDLGAIVGAADRLDTIVGCFSIGVVPTGSADPFGLRRAALGVLRLFADREWTVDLQKLVARAADQVAKQQDLKIDGAKVEAEVLDFLRVRFRGLLTDGNSLPGDCVDAALSIGFQNPRDARARAEAVSQLRGRDDFEPLAAAFKRVANILKGQSTTSAPNPDAFVEEDEHTLWKAFEGVRERVDLSLAKQDYVRALEVLSELKGPVDCFFEAVLVMDKDEGVRSNRLAMLGKINDTFTRIADFRQLAV
jgi:glycyl-tRNA synthetase beta chain